MATLDGGTPWAYLCWSAAHLGVRTAPATPVCLIPCGSSGRSVSSGGSVSALSMASSARAMSASRSSAASYVRWSAEVASSDLTGSRRVVGHAGRRDVLVEPEEVSGVVVPLDARESLVVHPEGVANPLFALGPEVIDVDRRRGQW